MQRLQVKEQLIGLFPPGTETVIDWQDEPGELVDAVAGGVKEFGTDLADKLRNEVNPLTATDLIPAWEAGFRIRGSQIALYGDLTQRRNQVIARWRQKGPPTIPKIQAVIGPLLDYADPSQLVVLEVDRDALRAAHVYGWTGSLSFGISPATITWTVLDRAKVARAGAQVDVTINHPDLSKVSFNLIGPDGTQQATGPLGRRGGNGTFRGFCPKLAGAQIAGTWTMLIGATSGTGTITAAGLFVEGLGREPSGLQGRGAAKFHWGVVADPALMGPRASLRAAAEAINRINYATRNGRIVHKSGVSPETCVVPDEPAAIPDECIPC